MRLLVAGGAGFIGSNFIRHWVTRHTSDRVINLDALTYAGDRSSLADVETEHRDQYRFIRGDITDRRAVEEVIADERPDIVVNFAAETHNSRAVLDPGGFMRTNALGTQNLLDACRAANVPRFHQISTCEVYGDLALDSPDRFTETSPYRPRTPYNASKAAADHIVRAYFETFDLGVTISNCSNNYGPFQHPEKVIPLFITNALDGRPLPVYRNSAHRREWLHVEDHCRAIEMIIERGRPGETYNVGSGDERSIDELADDVLETVGAPRSLKTYVEDRPGHDRRYLLDHSKIARELGWAPVIPWRDGLRATVAWYRENVPWWWRKREGTVDEFIWTSGPARA